MLKWQKWLRPVATNFQDVCDLLRPVDTNFQVVCDLLRPVATNFDFFDIKKMEKNKSYFKNYKISFSFGLQNVHFRIELSLSISLSLHCVEMGEMAWGIRSLRLKA